MEIDQNAPAVAHAEIEVAAPSELVWASEESWDGFVVTLLRGR